MKVNWPILVVGLALAASLVAVLASGFGNDPHSVPSVLVGQRAPGIALADLDGNPVDTASVGKPMVINFWSTWCLPCKQEHGLLQSAARTTPGVQFLGVLYSDEPAKARRYLEKAGAAYPTLVDENNRTALDYGVAGVPETFFVDAEGNVIHKQVGPLTAPALRDLLARLGAR